MIGLRRTYQDVARKLDEGLRSGHVVLEHESTREELGSFVSLLFQYLSPKKAAFVIVGRNMYGSTRKNSQVLIQIDPKEYEDLPEEVKARFDLKTRGLMEKGVKIKVKDLHGRAIPMLRLLDRTQGIAT